MHCVVGSVNGQASSNDEGSPQRKGDGHVPVPFLLRNIVKPKTLFAMIDYIHPIPFGVAWWNA
jgi:hypothetical protein